MKTTVVTGELRRVEMTRLTGHGRRGRLGIRFLHLGAPSTDLSEQPTFIMLFVDDKTNEIFGFVIGDAGWHHQVL